jgi:hypothetical protein
MMNCEEVAMLISVGTTQYLPGGTENKSASGRDIPVTAWAYLRPINVWCLLYESLGFGAGSEPGSQNIVDLKHYPADCLSYLLS